MFWNFELSRVFRHENLKTLSHFLLLFKVQLTNKKPFQLNNEKKTTGKFAKEKEMSIY